MEWIPIFFGVIIALAVYAHFITKYNEYEDKLKRAEIKTDKEEKETPETTPAGPKKRFCPLCHSELKEHQSLYAEMYEGTPPKVIIHGCRNCYTPSGEKTKFNPKNLQEEI